ncbi:MAG: FAD-dependent oxidoreductase, partial [Bacteroidota bacterium]
MANAYDLLVIGSGPGGYVAGIRAAQLGMKVAVIERESLGGICLNWGCIPTKALLKSAEVFDYLNHAGDYGLKTGSVDYDFDAVIKRSRDVADGMNKGIQFLFKKNKVESIMGEARLEKKGEVVVKGEDGKETTYSAKHIIIAVGGKARELPGLEIDDDKIIEYRKAMTLEQLPKKLVIMGSGAIGCEFAYFYSTMGTEVTLVEYMDRILPASDKDVSRELARSFKKRGIKLMTGAKVSKAEKTDKGVKITIE